MELRLHDGDYVPSAAGGFETADGAREVFERAVFKLRARRGAFPPMPSLGSRLYSLGRVKSSERAAAAAHFIGEALEDEPGLEAGEVSVAEEDGTLRISARLVYGGESARLSMEV